MKRGPGGMTFGLGDSIYDAVDVRPDNRKV